MEIYVAIGLLIVAGAVLLWNGFAGWRRSERKRAQSETELDVQSGVLDDIEKGREANDAARRADDDERINQL